MGNESVKILKQEARQLTERYFEGATSIAEEGRLRSLLADRRLDGPDLDEARAVMGYAMFMPRARRHRSISWSAVSGMAAAIAVGVTVAFGLARNDSGINVQSQCIAYVGGHEVTDRDAVMAMVNEDLSDFSEALTDAEEQIDMDLSEFAIISSKSDNSL